MELFGFIAAARPCSENTIIKTKKRGASQEAGLAVNERKLCFQVSSYL
jgi:hypothetical protein